MASAGCGICTAMQHLVFQNLQVLTCCCCAIFFLCNGRVRHAPGVSTATTPTTFMSTGATPSGECTWFGALCFVRRCLCCSHESPPWLCLTCTIRHAALGSKRAVNCLQTAWFKSVASSAPNFLQGRHPCVLYPSTRTGNRALQLWWCSFPDCNSNLPTLLCACITYQSIFKLTAARWFAAVCALYMQLPHASLSAGKCHGFQTIKCY